MTRWEPCEYDDLFAVKMQVAQLWQDIRAEIAEPNAKLHETLRENARTLWSEHGEVLACVGISPLWKGVGAAWAFVSSEALRHPITLSRGTRDWLNWIIGRDDFWRIQATVEHGHTQARRWLLWMGFSYEGTMRCYSHMGTDHDMYARLVPRGTVQQEVAWVEPLHC